LKATAASVTGVAAHNDPQTVTSDELLAGSVELASMMTEHVVVFEVMHGASKWWAWCFVDLSGAGFDRVKFSKPFGPIEVTAPDELDLRTLRSAPRMLFEYDTPIVED
jgi:hypothetical protein